MFLMDLSVPRNIVPSVDELDALPFQSMVLELLNRGIEHEKVKQAEEMVHTEVIQFVRLMSDVEMGP